MADSPTLSKTLQYCINKSSVLEDFSSHKRLYSHSTERTSERFEYSDFCNSLLKETRRISPTFAFSKDSGPFLKQILSLFKQAVDEYMQKYSNQIVRHQKQNSFLSLSSADLLEDESKAKQTLKNLMKFEKILMFKEVKVKNKAQTIKNELLKLKELAENLEKDKSSWKTLKETEEKLIENDRKIIKRQKEVINQVLSDLKLKKTQLESQESELVQKVVESEKYFSDLERSLSQKQAFVDLETLKLEKIKWELEKRVSDIESKESMLRLKISNFSKEQAEFEQEKSFILKQKLNYGKGAHVKKNCRPDLDSLFNIPELSPLNSPNGPFSPILFESRSNENQKDFESAYIELNEQIEKINKELESKEESLLKREAELSELSDMLNEKGHQYSLIFRSLSETKASMEEFNSRTLIELELKSNHLEDLINSLKSQKTELDFLTEQVQKQLQRLSKSVLEVIKEEPANPEDLETVESESD